MALTFIFLPLSLSSLQRRRQFRGDPGDEGDADVVGEGGVEAAGDLPLELRDGRRVLSLRRADLRHEVRQLDLRRIPGTQRTYIHARRMATFSFLPSFPDLKTAYNEAGRVLGISPSCNVVWH